jgi:hypothetical protein
MVDTDLNKTGRSAVHLKFKGISVSEYIQTVMKGLENDSNTIFQADGQRVMTESRAESENRLLKPSW